MMVKEIRGVAWIVRMHSIFLVLPPVSSASMYYSLEAHPQSYTTLLQDQGHILYVIKAVYSDIYYTYSQIVLLPYV
jgi:hypothetical protein